MLVDYSGGVGCGAIGGHWHPFQGLIRAHGNRFSNNDKMLREDQRPKRLLKKNSSLALKNFHDFIARKGPFIGKMPKTEGVRDGPGNLVKPGRRWERDDCTAPAP